MRAARVVLDDLALVCANCHRMIHASRPWLTMDELRGTLLGAKAEGTTGAVGSFETKK